MAEETTAEEKPSAGKPKPITIVSLTVSNVKRIKACEITPDRRMVKLGGRNKQGKSSILDSIEMAMRGKTAMPPEPLRQGARKGSIILDLGELVVERRFTQDGDPTLVVKNAEGVPQKRPQELLDNLCSAVAFDAGEFSSMEPKKQDAILKQLMNIDFTLLDKKRAEEFDARTDKKRTFKANQAVIDAMVEHPGLPKVETPVAEVAKQLAAAREAVHNRERSLAIEDRARDGLARAERHVAGLEAQLVAARAEVAANAEALTLAQKATVELGEPPDTAELEEKLASTEETNKKIRWNTDRKAKVAAQSKLDEEIDGHTTAIEKIDEQKAEILAGADFPVPGLGFGEMGPTLNGLPFEQASDAEKIRVSTALGFRLNPRFKVVLIRKGSLCDNDALKIVAEIAEAEGGQVWVEMVSKTESEDAECQFVVDDGEIKETVVAAE